MQNDEVECLIRTLFNDAEYTVRVTWHWVN
jgi:hypothetical protein